MEGLQSNRSAIARRDLRTAETLVAVLDGINAARTAGGVIESLPKPLVEGLGVYSARAIGRLRGAPVESTFARDEREGSFFSDPLDDTCVQAMGEERPVEHRFRARKLGFEVAFVAVPLRDGSGLTVGAVGFAFAHRGADDVAAQLATLDAVARMVELAPSWSAAGDGEGSANAEAADGGSQLGKSAGYENEVALAFALTNSLCTRLDCELVALGIADGPQVRLLSVSGLEEVRGESPAVEALSMAMGEALDLEYRATAPTSELESGRRVPALLEAWQHVVGGSVAVIPIGDGDGTRGVVAMRRAPGMIFEGAELERVAELIAPYLPALDLLRRARRSLATHVLDSTRAQWVALRRPGAWTRRAVAAAVALFGLWFLFGTMPHSLTVPCTVASDQVRHLAAPYEGVLRAAPFTAGQRVREDDVLASFDTSFEQLERAQLVAELAVLDVDLREALAGDDALGQRRLAEQEAALRAKLELAELRLERAEIRAPFDGVVLAGDLRDRVGDTLTQGDTLFELAPDSGWRVELQVPEHQALELSEGQTGQFSTRARPEVRHEFEVVQIAGAVETVGAAAVLRVEGRVDDQSAWVRPGMEGSAKVRVAGRAPWAKLAGPLVDWLRLRFVL